MPGKGGRTCAPTGGFAEVVSLNRSSRATKRRIQGFDGEEVLSSYLFNDLDEVRDITWEWMLCYNEERPPQVARRAAAGGLQEDG
jgi:transposase InsO family protein